MLFRSTTSILPTVFILIILTVPLSVVRAASGDSPWQPFIDASWQATTPDEYIVAEQLFDKISKDGNKLPQDNLKFIWGLNRVASYYHTEGNSKAEERFLARSFRLQESKLGKKNPMLATHLQQLAHVWLKQKKYTRAKQALERALKLIEDRFGTEHILTINILEDLVKISNWFSDRPYEPQMLLYALANADKLAALVYGQLTTGKLRYMGLAHADGIIPAIELLEDGKYSPDHLDWQSLIGNWSEVVGQLAEQYCRGDHAVDPLEKACEWCALPVLCRVAAKNYTQPADLDLEEGLS